MDAPQSPVMKVLACGLPDDCLRGEDGDKVDPFVIELGGSDRDRLVTCLSLTDDDADHTVRTTWWQRFGRDRVSSTDKSLDTAGALDQAITEVMRESAHKGTLRLKLVDRVLVLPAHQMPSFRITTTQASFELEDDSDDAGEGDVISVLVESELDTFYGVDEGRTPSSSTTTVATTARRIKNVGSLAELSPGVLRDVIPCLTRTELNQLAEQTSHLRHLLDASENHHSMMHIPSPADDDRARASALPDEHTGESDLAAAIATQLTDDVRALAETQPRIALRAMHTLDTQDLDRFATQIPNLRSLFDAIDHHRDRVNANDNGDPIEL